MASNENQVAKTYQDRCCSPIINEHPFMNVLIKVKKECKSIVPVNSFNLDYQTPICMESVNQRLQSKIMAKFLRDKRFQTTKKERPLRDISFNNKSQDYANIAMMNEADMLNENRFKVREDNSMHKLYRPPNIQMPLHTYKSLSKRPKAPLSYISYSPLSPRNVLERNFSEVTNSPIKLKKNSSLFVSGLLNKLMTHNKDTSLRNEKKQNSIYLFGKRNNSTTDNSNKRQALDGLKLPKIHLRASSNFKRAHCIMPCRIPDRVASNLNSSQIQCGMQVETALDYLHNPLTNVKFRKLITIKCSNAIRKHLLAGK
jgi:hypothetical protein